MNWDMSTPSDKIGKNSELILDDLFVAASVGWINRGNDVIGFAARLDVSIRKNIRQFLSFCIQETDD